MVASSSVGLRLPLPLLAVLAVLLVLSAAGGASAAARRRLLDLKTYPTATCNDGTPSGYYFRPSPSGSTEWVFWLMGGGYCFDGPSCSSRSSVLTSSSQWPEQMNLTSGILNPDPFHNAQFAPMNLVFVGYCTSDLYAGTAANSSVAGGFSFRGASIVPAVVADVAASLPSFAKSTRVLFGGSSAGGVGTFTNAHKIRDLPEFQHLDDVSLLPDAGWFINSTSFEAGRPYVYETIVEGSKLWQPVYDPWCLARHAGFPQRCFLAQNIYPGVTQNIFVWKALTDNWVVKDYNKISPPYTAAQDAWMMRLAHDVYGTEVQAGARSIFSANCVVHVGVAEDFWTTLGIDGISLQAAITRWWNGETVHLVDTCFSGPNCNPLCPTHNN